MDLDLVISGSSVQMMTAVAAERGLDPGLLLAGSGVDPQKLAKPGAEVTIRQEYAVMRRLVAAFPSVPGLGADIGRHYHLAMHGTWGLLIATSRTLRDAIELALHYLELAWAFTPVTIAERDGMAVLAVGDEDIPADVRVYLVDRVAASARVLLSELIGQEVILHAVRMRHSGPSDTSAYLAAFGVVPEFGAEGNALLFPAELLDRVLPQGNEWVRAGYEHACAELLDRRRARSGVAGAVRHELTRVPGYFPDLDEVAEALTMSSRTMLRRLRAEGTTFRELVDEVRSAIAEDLLLGPGLTTEQVAYRLGYAESTSFVRAFKRWKGLSPQAFRRAATA